MGSVKVERLVSLVPGRDLNGEVRREEWDILVRLGLAKVVEESWTIESRDSWDEHPEWEEEWRQGEEEETIWLDEVWEEVSSRREAFDWNLTYARSQGLVLFPFQERGVSSLEEIVRWREEEGGGKGGALNFDDMGLGKTMEAIAFVARRVPKPRRILVICPNTLKLEWKKSVEKWLDPERCVVYASRRGGLRRFYGLLEEEFQEKWLAAEMKWLITNYETLRTKSYLEIVQSFKPQVIVWDECHRLRNWERKTARASEEMDAPVCLFMSGSPVVNHAGDLWSPLHRVWPEKVGDVNSFEYNFTYVRRGMYGTSKYGVRNQEELKEILSKVAIQRKKADVLKELPPKIYREVPLDLEGEQRELYEQMENSLFIMLDSGLPLQANSVLAQMTRLRQLCLDPRILGVGRRREIGICEVCGGEGCPSCAGVGKVMIVRGERRDCGECGGTGSSCPECGGSGKVGVSEEEMLEVELTEEELVELQKNRVLAEAERIRKEVQERSYEVVGAKTEFLLEFLEDIGEEQIVVFSNFEQYISLLEEEIKKKLGLSVVRLTGKEVGDKRAENIEAFTKGQYQVLLGTTQAGGEGVNLQVASKVVLMDRWWSPVRNEQAIDRVHRIGQLNQVVAILPHAEDTIDDALREILARKYKVINELRIRGDTMALLREWRKRR